MIFGVRNGCMRIALMRFLLKIIGALEIYHGLRQGADGSESSMGLHQFPPRLIPSQGPSTPCLPARVTGKPHQVSKPCVNFSNSHLFSLISCHLVDESSLIQPGWCRHRFSHTWTLGALDNLLLGHCCLCLATAFFLGSLQ